jgi:hypothetical protein
MTKIIKCFYYRGAIKSKELTMTECDNSNTSNVYSSLLAVCDLKKGEIVKSMGEGDREVVFPKSSPRTEPCNCKRGIFAAIPTNPDEEMLGSLADEIKKMSDGVDCFLFFGPDRPIGELNPSQCKSVTLPLSLRLCRSE